MERLPLDGEDKLADWLRFLRAEEEEEFKMLAEKNPMIREAYCKLQAMSENEANRMVYEARLKAQRDDYSRMNGAHQKGRQEGREEGELNATRRIVLEMGKKGLDIETIAAVTHLSEQEVNNILKEKT